MSEIKKPFIMSRRAFMGASAMASLSLLDLPAFAADEPITFWDMVWGVPPYPKVAAEITAAYQPAAGLRGVRYQSIPWANWYQTFTSAAASGTTPAVSSGAAFLPFPFIDQGIIAPADNLIATLDKEGKNDFLPGVLDAMRTDKGLAAVPWSLDLRVFWYRKSKLEQAGADVPTDWASFLAAGEKLAKIGCVSLGMAAGSTTTDAQHTIQAMLINNGGGYFAKDGTLDCVNDRNIETVEYLLELAAKGIIDPYAVSYTQDNLNSDWASGHVAMGFGQTSLDRLMPEDQRSDFVVASPLKSPHGDLGTVYYINPLMMFTTTQSQESSEAFLAYYLDNLKTYWERSVTLDLPVKRSITELPIIQNDPHLVKSVNEWQPIGKTIGAQSDHAFAALNAVDGGSASATFVQQIVEGGHTAKTILETLQSSLERVVNKS